MVHTPGVWQIAQPRGAGTARMIWRNDEGPNSSAETNTNHRIIARDVHNEGDARLIAASPELLAALDRANRLLAELTFTAWIGGDDAAAVDMRQRIKGAHETAAAAIARAEGR